MRPLQPLIAVVTLVLYGSLQAQTLQQVTNAGSTTTNSVTIGNANGLIFGVDATAGYTIYSHSLKPSPTAQRTLQFDCYSTAPGGGWEFYNSDLAKTLLYIQQSGNVGINTDNPIAKLHVKNGTIAISDQDFDHINAKLTMADQVPLLRFTRWTGSGQIQHNAFVGQFFNASAGEYSLGLGTGSSNSGNQEEASPNITVKLNGNVGIGTANPLEKLVVAGNMQARRIKVTVDAGADFVFEKNYRLRKLDELKRYIEQYKHLPEVPPAKEMETNGIELAGMSVTLLQKIEELTLYLIDQHKEIKEQRQIIADQKHLLEDLENRLKKLEKEGSQNP